MHTGRVLATELLLLLAVLLPPRDRDPSNFRHRRATGDLAPPIAAKERPSEGYIVVLFPIDCGFRCNVAARDDSALRSWRHESL